LFEECLDEVLRGRVMIQAAMICKIVLAFVSVQVVDVDVP